MIPSGVISIGDRAFNSCSDLTSIVIPDGVISIGDHAFGGCSGLTNIKIPNGITSIDEQTFNCCDGLTSVTIPVSVTSIKERAFDGCSGLKDVYYSGSESEWNGVAIKSDNDPLRNANMHYNSIGLTITFDTKGGSAISPVTVEASKKVEAPTNAPTKEGYIFTGWYADEACSNKYDFSTPVISDLTLYAGWTKAYTLTVTNGTGSGTYAAGTKVSITAVAPDKVFDRWTGEDPAIFENAASPTTTIIMPAKNATVTATYKDAPTPPAQTYTLTVTGGTGGGTYAAGAAVSITANAAPTGKVFDK